MLEIIIIISALFISSLWLKRFFPRLCAICIATSAAWSFGLVLHFTDIFSWEIDPIILALLLGGSSVGLLYYLPSILPAEFEVFKLPFLLTTFTLSFFIIDFSFDWRTLAAVATIWLLFAILYFSRSGRLKNWFEKVAECCRNW